MPIDVRIRLWVMMFLEFFVWGTWYVTMGTYLTEMGFPGTSVGSAYSTTSIAAIISPFFVGLVADRFLPGQIVLGIMHLLGAGLLYYTSTISDPTLFFWVLLAYTLCYMPTLSLVNAISFQHMQDPGKEFPAIRVLGTIGWIAAGLLIGYLAVEKTSTPMVIGAGASVVLGIFSFVLPNTPPKATGQGKGQVKGIGKLGGYALAGGLLGFAIGLPISYWFQAGALRTVMSLPGYLKEIFSSLTNSSTASATIGSAMGFLDVALQTALFFGFCGVIVGAVLCKSRDKDVSIDIGEFVGAKAFGLLKDPSFAIFTVCSLLICIPLSFYYNFTNVFLNELGVENAAGKMTLGQMSEIGFMVVMPFFFARLGVKKMLLIGMLAWTLRYFLFAFGNSESLVFMLYSGIILHGICFDFFFVTGQIYVDRAAPDDIRASAQGFVALITYGAGMYIGSILSGMVVEHYTVKTGEVVSHVWASIWLIPAVMAIVISVIFAITFKDKPQDNATSA